jgi:hypothetical protein
VHVFGSSLGLWCGCWRVSVVGGDVSWRSACGVFVCECQGMSNERGAGAHSAVRLTWGVVWLVWCCGLKQEGPPVLCTQERSGRGGGCHRVSAGLRCYVARLLPIRACVCLLRIMLWFV